SSRGGPYLPGPWGVSTRKDDKIYLHVFRWPADNILKLPELPGMKVKHVRQLSGGAINYNQNKDAISIQILEECKQDIVTSIELQMSASVMDINPIYLQEPLTSKATITASHSKDDVWKLTDYDATTTWLAEKGKNEGDIWIEAAFEETVTIASVVTGRGDEWVPRHNPELQIPDGKGGWKTVFAWKPKWAPVKFLDEPVTTDKVRLKIGGTSTYYLAEFELYAPL
ncbi:hypothetical protein ACFLRQ_03535, partial [Bacteroidota bacterium]